jgi:predicted dehydrogenase
MSGTLRLGVVGVGHLGRHHVRILATLPGVSLAGIADANAARAQDVAAAHGTTPFTDWRQLLGQVDAVTIATPTESHAQVASAFIDAGVHVLVEKPLTRTLAEADALLAAARDRGVTLAVGHTERFNPAVQAVRPLLTRPRFIEVHRLGTFPERSLDIDVVFDLMIHDLDLVLSLVGSTVTSIDAVGVPVLTPRVDIANVRLHFENGCTVNLTASRISRDRVRKIRFFQPHMYVSVDYAAQEAEVYKLVRGDDGRPTIQGGKADVAREEPLKLELADFVAAVRERRAPGVTGEQGRAALALAAAIVERMDHGQ